MLQNGWFLIFKFCRMTLLLGPPSSGKTTLLLALAGKLGKDLKVRSHGFSVFVFKKLFFAL